MTELRGVFEMTTKQVEPDVDAWRDLEDRQRRASRNRRNGALAVVAALGIAAAVFAIRLAGDEGENPPVTPITPPPSTEAPVPETDYTIDLDTGVMTPLPAAIVGEADETGGYVVSPDGARIAYVGPGEDGGSQILVANVDGTDIRQVTHAFEASLPGWSPDGTRIAYVGREDAGRPSNIFVLDLATGDATRITSETGEVFGTQFSPDGSSIVYTADRGNGDGVFIVSVTGGKSTLLVGGGGDAGDAGDGLLSPDGSLLSYGHSEVVGGLANRWVANADGSDPRPLVENGNYPSASWSPDSTRIATFSSTSKDVSVVDVTTGEARVVAMGAWPQWLDDHTLIVEVNIGF